MPSHCDYIQFVTPAQQGNQQALNDLTEAVRGPLKEYVQRLTLDEHLAQDLVQETLMCMVRQFSDLRDPQAFWPWLSHIALNKVRTHYRSNWRRQKILNEQPPSPVLNKNVQDTVGKAIENEVKQLIITALHRLSPEHRVVITLRCYEQLTFDQMAAQLGHSEFKVRSLFYRAQKALGKNLTRCGLGKESLIGALILFGKMSACSETAVARIAISEATLKVGCWSTVGAVLTSHATATMLTLGVGILITGLMLASSGLTVFSTNDIASAVPSFQPTTDQQLYYYYPSGDEDRVQIRARKLGDNGNNHWQCVQDDHGNNYRHGKKIWRCNAHLWQTNGSVTRLPTDSPALRNFLDRIEGRPSSIAPTRSNDAPLLVVHRLTLDGPETQCFPDFDPTDEEYFLRPWADGCRQVDRRDAIHQQGWCGFTITGTLAGRQIRGSGCLPLVPIQYEQHPPTLSLTLGNNNSLNDLPDQAFFQGLSRPWCGLHTVDTIRRDAAHLQLPFALQEGPRHKWMTVTLTDGLYRYDYQVDMDADLLREIICWNQEVQIGNLTLDYHLTDKSTPNITDRRPDQSPQQGPSCWWLTALANGSWETDKPFSIKE